MDLWPLQGAVAGVMVAEAVQDLTLDQGLFHDLRGVQGSHLLIGDLLGAQQHPHAFGAQALATGGLEFHLALQAPPVQLLPEDRRHCFTSQGQAAGPAAHQDLGPVGVQAALQLSPVFRQLGNRFNLWHVQFSSG